MPGKYPDTAVKSLKYLSGFTKMNTCVSEFVAESHRVFSFAQQLSYCFPQFLFAFVFGDNFTIAINNQA